MCSLEYSDHYVLRSFSASTLMTQNAGTPIKKVNIVINIYKLIFIKNDKELLDLLCHTIFFYYLPESCNLSEDIQQL